MGVKGLTKFIQECGKLVSYNEYKNKYVVVDIFQKIYKYCSPVYNLKNDDCTKIYNKHIKSILNSINHFKKFDIIPVYVFDGLSLALKTKNKKNKKEIDKIDKENNEICKIDEENNDKKNIIHKKIHKKNNFKITPAQIKECEMLLNLHGIPHIRAPYEADSQCAAFTLCKKNNIQQNIDTVITDDTDTLVFGASSITRMLPITIVNILRQLFRRFVCFFPNPNINYSINDIINILNDKNTGEILCGKICMTNKYSFNVITQFSSYGMINFAVKYDLCDILLLLTQKSNNILQTYGLENIKNFTFDKFIDMCILFGTDYSQRICDMTISDIFKQFVLSNFNITKMIQQITNKNINIDNNYLLNHNDVKEYYKNASVFDPMTINIEKHIPNQIELYNFLLQLGFSHYYIINHIKLCGT
jgi:hypothetical protein